MQPRGVNGGSASGIRDFFPTDMATAPRTGYDHLKVACIVPAAVFSSSEEPKVRLRPVDPAVDKLRLA